MQASYLKLGKGKMKNRGVDLENPDAGIAVLRVCPSPIAVMGVLYPEEDVS
jgi:hypothetical protein